MKPSDEIGDAARRVNKRMRIHHQSINSPIKSIDYHSKIDGGDGTAWAEIEGPRAAPGYRGY